MVWYYFKGQTSFAHSVKINVFSCSTTRTKSTFDVWSIKKKVNSETCLCLEFLDNPDIVYLFLLSDYNK